MRTSYRILSLILLSSVLLFSCKRELETGILNREILITVLPDLNPNLIFQSVRLLAILPLLPAMSMRILPLQILTW